MSPSKPKVVRELTITISIDVTHDVDRTIGTEVREALDYLRLVYDKAPLDKTLEVPYSVSDYGRHGPTTFSVSHRALEERDCGCKVCV